MQKQLTYQEVSPLLEAIKEQCMMEAFDVNGQRSKFVIEPTETPTLGKLYLITESYREDTTAFYDGKAYDSNGDWLGHIWRLKDSHDRLVFMSGIFTLVEEKI
jgi:hypothetical protein